MSSWKRHFRAVAKATEPPAEAVDRLRARASWPGQLLRVADSPPGPDAVARLRARRLTPRRPVPRAVVPALALAAAFLAAVLLRAPAPLDEQLASVSLISRGLTTDVRLDYAGAGNVAGTVETPRIHWEAGTLAVEVNPGKGVDLSVETDEALVQVVGTVFQVDRDALGTTVAVTRGHVRVSCGSAHAVDLLAGDRTVCPPVRAAGWIGRTQALIQAGRPTDELLEGIAAGQALASGDDPARGELEALRIRVLMDASRYDEALNAAEAYLASGALPRRDEVAALAASLRARP